MVVAGREEHHRVGPGGLHHGPGVGGDAGAPRQDAAVERLQVGEGGVGPGDVHDRLPRASPVPVPEGGHGEVAEVVPVGQAELQDRDGLVGPGDPGLALLEDLDGDHRVPPVVLEHLPRPDEVLIRVVARPHLVDRELEDLRVEAVGELNRRRRPVSGLGGRVWRGHGPGS